MTTALCSETTLEYSPEILAENTEAVCNDFHSEGLRMAAIDLVVFGPLFPFIRFVHVIPAIWVNPQQVKNELS